MDEEKKTEIEEELKDDGKIHFPLAGIIIIGVLAIAMIVCLIIISVNGGVR